MWRGESFSGWNGNKKINDIKIRSSPVDWGGIVEDLMWAEENTREITCKKAIYLGIENIRKK